MSVTMLLQYQQRTNELLFGYVHADAMEITQLCIGIDRRRQYDGLTTIGKEKRTILQDEVHRYEIMHVFLIMGRLELGKRTKCVDFYNRHYVL